MEELTRRSSSGGRTGLKIPTIARKALSATIQQTGMLTAEQLRDVILILCRVWYAGRSLHTWAKEQKLLRDSD